MAEPPRSRPLVERLLLLVVAVVMAAAFLFMGAAAWVSGEPPLAVMGFLGAGMTLWVGLLTLRRG
jgi:hypothetical protein